MDDTAGNYDMEKLDGILFQPKLFKGPLFDEHGVTPGYIIQFNCDNEICTKTHTLGIPAMIFYELIMAVLDIDNEQFKKILNDEGRRRIKEMFEDL